MHERVKRENHCPHSQILKVMLVVLVKYKSLAWCSRIVSINSQHKWFRVSQNALIVIISTTKFCHAQLCLFWPNRNNVSFSKWSLFNSTKCQVVLVILISQLDKFFKLILTMIMMITIHWYGFHTMVDQVFRLEIVWADYINVRSSFKHGTSECWSCDCFVFFVLKYRNYWKNDQKAPHVRPLPQKQI